MLNEKTYKTLFIQFLIDKGIDFEYKKSEIIYNLLALDKKNYIGNNKILKRKNQLIDLLNNLKPVKSKIFINYAPSGGNERQYFSDYNAMKIDAIRLKIEEWKNKKSRILGAKIKK